VTRAKSHTRERDSQARSLPITTRMTLISRHPLPRISLVIVIGYAIMTTTPRDARAQGMHVASSSQFQMRTVPANPDSAALTDTAGIRSVVGAFADAWGRADAAAIASLFTPDGDLVIPTGLQVRGRTHLHDFYASAFAKGYAGSTTTADITRIRAIAPGVMVVDAAWSIIGAKLSPGKVNPPERGILAAVIVKSTGRWWIAALREQEGAAALTSFDVGARAR
jgi:uncharacterized protein (TIGR02246 family)